MDRFAKQLLHVARPTQLRVLLNHSLQVAKLMRQTQLPVLSGRQKLRTIAIADPTLGAVLPHKLADDFRPARWRDAVDNPGGAAKDPLPPVAPRDAGAGFIAPNDVAVRHGV